MTDMSRFVGTWSLLAIESNVGRQGSGKPKGQIIYDAGGNMSAHVVLPAGEDGAPPPPYAGYFGTYTVDEAGSTITHHRVANTNPNAPKDVTREFRFTPEGHIVLTPRENRDNSLTFERISK